MIQNGQNGKICQISRSNLWPMVGGRDLKFASYYPPISGINWLGRQQGLSNLTHPTWGSSYTLKGYNTIKVSKKLTFINTGRMVNLKMAAVKLSFIIRHVTSNIVEICKKCKTRPITFRKLVKISRKSRF